jgi:hypothetical protein
MSLGAGLTGRGGWGEHDETVRIAVSRVATEAFATAPHNAHVGTARGSLALALVCIHAPDAIFEKAG